jgi:8-oxo-dGDP phosphatase
MIRDSFAPRPATGFQRLVKGRIFDFCVENVDLGEGQVVVREYIDHPGAVAILALDDQDRVAFINQYRHPVHSILWEIPAGLLDIDGEEPQDAAARELAEEVDLRAEEWHVLVDFLTSPGFNNEALRIYLARGLSTVPEDEKHVRFEEEADMHLTWVPLDDAVTAILDGSLHNPAAVVGVLAANAARAANWSTLRAPDAPWPWRRTVDDAED